MAGNVGRIFGGSSYGVGGFVPQQRGKKEEEIQQQPVPEKLEQPELSEEEIFKFLENGVVAPQKPVVPGEVDKETEERIAGYMSRFDSIIKVIEDEFGPELAPIAMDLVMDKLF